MAWDDTTWEFFCRSYGDFKFEAIQVNTPVMVVGFGDRGLGAGMLGVNTG